MDRPSWYFLKKEKESRILDLGCGVSKFPGSIGVDCAQNPSVDVVHDLNDFPYPFEDDSFHVIYMNHCIEHLIDPKKTLEECLRIARPDGSIFITLPHFTNAASFGDVTHRRYFSYRALLTLAKDLTWKNKMLALNNMRITARIPLLNPLINLAPRLWEDYFCFMITGRALYYEFKARKKP